LAYSQVWGETVFAPLRIWHVQSRSRGQKSGLQKQKTPENRQNLFSFRRQIPREIGTSLNKPDGAPGDFFGNKGITGGAGTSGGEKFTGPRSLLTKEGGTAGRNSSFLVPHGNHQTQTVNTHGDSRAGRTKRLTDGYTQTQRGKNRSRFVRIFLSIAKQGVEFGKVCRDCNFVRIRQLSLKEIRKWGQDNHRGKREKHKGWGHRRGRPQNTFF